jgi:uncharacterized glyoxalase superfamily protein PhnB
MAAVVDLMVADTAKAAEYYESLLAVTPDVGAANSDVLAGDHLRVCLGKGSGASPADTTLQVTSGMLARILDAAMKSQCTITVDSPEQVRLTDRYGQRWTLRCQLS